MALSVVTTPATGWFFTVLAGICVGLGLGTLFLVVAAVLSKVTSRRDAKRLKLGEVGWLILLAAIYAIPGGFFGMLLAVIMLVIDLPFSQSRILRGAVYGAVWGSSVSVVFLCWDILAQRRRLMNKPQRPIPGRRDGAV